MDDDGVADIEQALGARSGVGLSEGLCDVVLAAVDRTFEAGSARCRQCVVMGGETFSSSVGVVDFRRGRAALTTRFNLPAAQGRDTTTIIDGEGTIYTFAPPDLSRAPNADGGYGLWDQWVAVETEGAGVELTSAAQVAWLRGVTHAEQDASVAEALSFLRLALTLDLALAIERAPESERDGVRYGLENTRMGMTTAVIPASVTLDENHRVRWLQVTIPPSPSPWLPVAHADESALILELDQFGVDADIVPPHPDMTWSSVAEFLSLFSVDASSDMDDGDEPT